MESEHRIRRYRHWYAQLLRLHSKRYHERFGEGMEQTFSDLLRERAAKEKGLFGYALWVFVETSTGIIREKITHIMQKMNIVRILLGTACILLVPMVAMQFTDEVNWKLGDFVFMGGLLIGTGLMFELATRKADKIAHRLAVGIAVAAGLLLVWLNLAVGIIGTEGNPADPVPANLMYGGVLAVGLIGAIIARFQPRGMTRALVATAVAHALVPVLALVAGLVPAWPLDAFFVALWVGSALLFRHAGVTGSKLNRQIE